MEVIFQKLKQPQASSSSVETLMMERGSIKNPLRLLKYISSIGVSPSMDDYEKRKLGIFNQLNFFQLVTGITIPIIGLLQVHQLPAFAWIISAIPALVGVVVLFFNYHRQYESALLSYFILYPLFSSIVYLNGINTGVDLCFILYGVWAVFFLKDIGYMLFTIAFSMISYFVLAVLLKNYHYQLESVNKGLYLFNQILEMLFIFYGLFLIKRENAEYQTTLVLKTTALEDTNAKIEKQKIEIAEKADLLNIQTAELVELNSLRNRLFTVIAHDLKSPMYALRNLFRNVHQYNLPGEEVKKMIPDVVNDLNYTTSLMENLLEWVKSQMNDNSLKLEKIDLSKQIDEVVHLLRLQAEAKQINIECETTGCATVLADRNMIGLVLRNLISNAIKFTPQCGSIYIGANEIASIVEVYVQDTGIGISKEALLKINENNYYTTKGTASESGTGLGLMLCKEFLLKNNSQLHVESEVGKGTIFSFTLAKAEDHLEG